MVLGIHSFPMLCLSRVVVVAFTLLSLMVMSAPVLSLVVRVGILGLPPSPTGSFINLLAIQMSIAVISSR